MTDTKKPIRIKIKPSRASSIDNLLNGWDFETKENILGLLENYVANKKFGWKEKLLQLPDLILGEDESKHKIKHLFNTDDLRDTSKRFEITGEHNYDKSFEKLFETELGNEGAQYALKKLKEDLKDVFVPNEFGELLSKSYEKFILKKMTNNGKVVLPKAPLFLVVGPSGGGKTATVNEAIDDFLFKTNVTIEEDYSEKLEQLKKEKPFFWRTENPEFVEEVESQRLRDKVFRYIKNPFRLKQLFKEKPELLEMYDELQQLVLERVDVEPSDVQTKWYGETGHNLEKKIGNLTKPKVVYFEEFQGTAFGVGEDGVSESQQGSLITSLNSFLDGVISGSSPMIVLASTNAPGKIAKDVYRRFDEAGRVIDVSNYWKEEHNLEQIVRFETGKHDVDVSGEVFRDVTKSIYRVFNERSLKITPAYVRKLLSTIIKSNKKLSAELFEDRFVIREAFENVARNSHEDLFNKIVRAPPRDLNWKDYKGRVKDDFASNANAALRFNDENKKGIILFGPPGGGKTFLTKVYSASNKDLTYLSANLQDLQNPKNPVDGMVENVHTMYNIARMMAPSVINLQEVDAVIGARSQDGSNPYDKVTNAFLDIFDGDEPLNGVYTVMTTNLLQKIDRAFIRAKRADLLQVTGRLSEENRKALISNCLEGMVLDEEVDLCTLYNKMEGICFVPADYAKFVEDIGGLQSSQYKVLNELNKLFIENNSQEKIGEFIGQNTKAITGILEYYNQSQRIIEDAKQDPLTLLNHLDSIKELFSNVNSYQDFPIKNVHLNQVHEDFVNNPMRSGLEKKKSFMSYELSEEPQPGFIIGVGANDLFGVLTPIKTSLSDKGQGKIEVSGAVKTNSAMDGEENRGVGQMEHSALEAKTLVENYFSRLFSEQNNLKDFNPVWAVNELLNTYSIHHQFLTADYSGGGPSAGFALGVNTLSVFLNLDVMNDFGVTGAPWTGGKTKKDVGSSVIIGGAPQKADAVLGEKLLRRMFVPHKNYDDLPLEQHESYWKEGKLVRPVYNFRQLVPEVFCFDNKYQEKINDLIELQVKYNLGKINRSDNLEQVKKDLDFLENKMKTLAEKEILRRATCLYNFAVDSSEKKFSLSFDSIYKDGGYFDKNPDSPLIYSSKK